MPATAAAGAVVVTAAVVVEVATDAAVVEAAKASEALIPSGPRRGGSDWSTASALAATSREDLECMSLAAARLAECMRELNGDGASVVGELIKTRDEFTVWKHYPPGDVRDPDSHSQYYYHSHPEKLRPGEHGHFHTFMRRAGMPEHLAPSSRPGNVDLDSAKNPMAHLVGISVNDRSMPIALFTVNRWVTKDIWFDAEATIAMLDRFVIETADPSLPVNRWVSCMLVLFRPQIEMLIRRRDQTVNAWRSEDHETQTLNDKALEITSIIDISLRDQVSALDSALK